MSLSRTALITSFLLILTEQFLSLSQSMPTVASTVEALLTIAVILLFFRGLRAGRTAEKICACVSILVGAIYILSNIYLYTEGNHTIYFTSVVGTLQVVLGAFILIAPTVAIHNGIKPNYATAIVPIGYITLLYLHEPYPIEANITMFGMQLLLAALLVACPSNPGKRYKYATLGLTLLLSAIFAIYFVIFIIKGSNVNAIEYLCYAALTAWIALKTKS